MLTQILFVHDEQSEASLFNAVLRSIDFSPYGRRPWFATLIENIF